ncbi:MAG TPA: hypothetical protein VLF89_07755 [Candidatus Saccharimonadales bacterium]|nr:hypothetical protein [Candidatus Saccharimonadales bacterium]
MNLSFNEIKQLIENSVNGGLRSSLKFSFYLLLFITCFILVSLIFVELKLFDRYFTFIFRSLKTLGVTEELSKIVFIFTLTLVSYFVSTWFVIEMSRDFLVKRKYKWNLENDLYDFELQGNIVIDVQKKQFILLNQN